MSLSGLFIVISGMGGMTACSDAIDAARQFGGLHQFGSNWRRSGQSGTPSDVRSGATNPLLKSLALLAFWLCLKNSQRSPPISRFPRLGLAHLPTPLEPMRRLTEHLGGPRLWVKREDATGVGFGGNKLRKLDYVLHEAMAAKADTLVSGGVVQSNSQRQIAAAAAKLGLQCHLAVYHGRLSP